MSNYKDPAMLSCRACDKNMRGGSKPSSASGEVGSPSYLEDAGLGTYWVAGGSAKRARVASGR